MTVAVMASAAGQREDPPGPGPPARSGRPALLWFAGRLATPGTDRRAAAPPLPSSSSSQSAVVAACCNSCNN